MKCLLTGILATLACCSYAQRGGNMEQSSNALLNQSFWMPKPDVNAVKAAIEKGNDPAEMNRMAFDPVVMAINAGAPSESVIYLLQQKGNDVNKKTHDARTYLFWAASKGDVAVMEYLVSKGADATIQDSHGASVVGFAAMSGQSNTKVYDICIKGGANLTKDLNHDGANALLLGIGSDTTFALTQYFQSKGLDLKSKDAAGNTAFDYAARSGNTKMMKMLLEKGVSYSPTVMLTAAQGGRRSGNGIELFRYLESLGAKPNVTGKTGDNPLHYLVMRPGQTEVIRYFLGKGVSVNQANEEGNTVFMNAARSSRDTALLDLLLPLAKDINQANKAGATALSLAVRSNDAAIVSYLLNKGAKLNTVDAKGNGLVYYLFESYGPRQSREFDAKLNLLQSKGLSLAAPQADGNTVYHYAVAKNDLALLKNVQKYGADINAKNKEGLTPLHRSAMMSKDDSIIRYLVSIGADKNLKTNFDETAFDLASENELFKKANVSVDFLK